MIRELPLAPGVGQGGVVAGGEHAVVLNIVAVYPADGDGHAVGHPVFLKVGPLPGPGLRVNQRLLLPVPENQGLHIRQGRAEPGHLVAIGEIGLAGTGGNPLPVAPLNGEVLQARGAGGEPPLGPPCRQPQGVLVSRRVGDDDLHPHGGGVTVSLPHHLPSFSYFFR